MNGEFNPNNYNIDVPGGLMWEYTFKGMDFHFRVDDIAGIGQEWLERYDDIWARMIQRAYELGFNHGRDEILNKPLKDLFQ